MRLPISITLNGATRQLEIDTRLTLVSLVRDELGLTGTHVGCTTGNCGACTVLLDGETAKSCCVLAADIDGQEITTIEAFSSRASDLHPIQQAFSENQGLQCGFCTPGMVLSTYYLLGQNPDPTEDEIRRGISGNLCRCTGYQMIVDSVMDAAKRVAGST
jgi:carbon-monoxide dehydrogenase small subunit